MSDMLATMIVVTVAAAICAYRGLERLGALLCMLVVFLALASLVPSKAWAGTPGCPAAKSRVIRSTAVHRMLAREVADLVVAGRVLDAQSRARVYAAMGRQVQIKRAAAEKACRRPVRMAVKSMSIPP